MRFRKVVRFYFSALVAEVEAVGGDFEEEDFPGLPREFLVEQEDAGLHAGVGLEDSRGQADHGDEAVLDEKAAELHIGVLRGSDDAVGHDHAAATVGREMFGDVVGEKNL